MRHNPLGLESPPYKVDARHYAAYFRYAQRQFPIRTAVSFALGPLFSVAFVAWMGGAPFVRTVLLGEPWMLLILAVPAVGLPVFLASAPWIAGRRLASVPGNRTSRRATVAPTGLTIATDVSSRLERWVAVEEIRETPEIILFSLGSSPGMANAVFIPKSAFPTREACDEFSSLAGELWAAARAPATT